ncbi:MAG: hypothetical protein Q7V31_11995 [Parvibaculum sp.]|uniref:hypothetical protein n=1 Tax=Parvibaculum sp. TaxID=2024848 RepID=UPI0027217C48|nr:hypothetical protein [Parvibaculum sp.]MDO8839639.1 hypothetical protein [Parvibaculum sp.]
MKAFNRMLNVATMHIASRLFPCGFDVTADLLEAPDTLARLNAHIAETGRMLVWSGASRATIFGDEQVNWAFRAWHDFHHWKGQHDFTLRGELATAQAQQADLAAVYGAGPHTEAMQALVAAEVHGQTLYAHYHDGNPPTNQRAFTLHYMVNPLAAVVSDF